MRILRGVITSAFFAVACVLVATSHAQVRSVPTENDTALATQIEHKLSADREVNAQAIKIDVRDGVATLTGRVNAPDVKRRAEQVTAAVPGITDVRNQISVSGAGLRGEDGAGPIPEAMPGAH
jgi:hypothetical protein